ncbi:MAG TPA: TPM domain-containing protein [Thermoanaerobaculia bacterium]|nr:TPM domain-containing protein [Thermoanaerobaculia bacterium]
MMRLRRLISSLIPHPSSLLLAFIALATPVLALEVPPPPTTFVTDKAGILDESSAHALNEKLAAFEQRSGAQFIIYIFPTLDDEVLEDFTIRCAEKWKVGNKKYDNGLILFVFVKERKLRIEVGYGLEPTITDAFSRRVIEQYIAPHFRQGDYAGGLNAAADALTAQIEHKEAPVAPAQPRRTSGRGAPAASVGFAPCGVILFILFIILIASLITRSRPGCGGCFWPMFFLGGGGGRTFGGGGWGGGGGGWSGFSGGGGSFGGGGASGGW